MRTCLRLFLYTLLICGFFSVPRVNAQVSHTEAFDNDTTPWMTEFETFGYTDVITCSGEYSVWTNLYSDQPSAVLYSPSIGTSNGLAINLSYSYKLVDYDFFDPTEPTQNEGDWGSFTISYATSAAGPFTVIQTVNPSNHIESASCAVKTATFTPPAGSQVFLRFDATLGDDSNDFFLYIDDISAIQLIPACSGAPAANNPVINSFSCSNQALMSFSVSATGTTYQWQSSPDGITFTNVATGGTGLSYTATVAATTWYRVVTTCTASGQSTPGTAVKVNYSGISCPCPFVYTEDIEPITLVNFAGINNVTSPTVNATPDIENFMYLDPAQVIKGQTYPITVKGNTNGPYTTYFAVYIDFNNNGVLNDAGEVFQIGSVNTSSGVDAQQAVANILIPQGAVTGAVRMRVIKLFNATPIDPCSAAYAYGQAEDYVVNIAVGNACSAAPAMATVQTTKTVVCNTATAQLSLSIPYTESGITYQWQSSTDGTTFTDIATATSNTYTTLASTVNRHYRAVITCNGTLSTTTASILITALGLPCPCDVIFEEDVEPITLVNFAGINNTTSATVNGTPAVQDFTGLTPGEVTAGSSYPIVLKGNTNDDYINAFTVFIDFNQNGLFTDAGESFQVGTIENSTGLDAIQATGTIAIPSTALAGPTYMRVMKLFEEFADDPCSSEIGIGYGQVEDYLLNVTAAPPCATPAPAAAANQYFCDAATVDGLDAIASPNATIVWYADETGGTALNTDASLIDGGIYYAAQIDGCESILRTPVTVTISTVVVDELEDVSVCESYVLPVLTDGAYYTEASGGGLELTAGDEIEENATIYIYAESGTTPNCTAESSFTVTIIEVEDLTGATEQAFETSGTIADLEVTGEDGAVISWYATEENAEEGIDPLDDTQVLENGTYYASQLVGECRSDTFAVTVSIIILDVKGFNANAFSYYPNPVKDVLTLSYNNTITTVEVYNFLGQQIMAKAINQNEAKLDMSQFAAGTYMVKLNTENGSTAVKVLKQ